MMDARLMWMHQSALERRGAVALARLGWHAFPVDDATRVRQRMPAHRPSLVISLGMLSSSYRSFPFVTPFTFRPSSASFISFSIAARGSGRKSKLSDSTGCSRRVLIRSMGRRQSRHVS